MAAALGLPEEDLELSMGMSADFEQAVRAGLLCPDRARMNVITRTSSAFITLPCGCLLNA